jgi:ribosomal protein L40E
MNWNIKTDKVFQNEWNKFKGDYSIDSYVLKYVFEIYLPFWQCKQNIVVERDLEMDRFSKILLELISNEFSSHADICEFLGIEKDNFCAMQLDFLIKNNLIREIGTDGYEITYEGLEFLKNKKKPKTMETEEFDYMVKEKYSFLENDITNDFFDPSKPIDKQLSDTKKADFSGYKILQTHKIKKEPSKVYIKYNNNPTYRKVESKRNNFSEFFNSLNPNKIFYDFADNEFESHKRSICFLGFWYENEKKPEDRKVDIRQFEESVEKFEKNEREDELSKKVTEYVLKNDVRVGNERSIAQENETQKTTKQSEFKFCSECGNKLKIIAKFCTKCGTEQDTEVMYEQ